MKGMKLFLLFHRHNIKPIIKVMSGFDKLLSSILNCWWNIRFFYPTISFFFCNTTVGWLQLVEQTQDKIAAYHLARHYAPASPPLSWGWTQSCFWGSSRISGMPEIEDQGQLRDAIQYFTTQAWSKSSFSDDFPSLFPFAVSQYWFRPYIAFNQVFVDGAVPELKLTT